MHGAQPRRAGGLISKRPASARQRRVSGSDAGDRRIVAALWTLVGLALIPLLFLAAPYLVPVVAALVVALVLGPVQGGAVARGLPQPLVALGLTLGLLAGFLAVTAAMAGSFSTWIADLPRIGRALQALIVEFRGLLGLIEDAGEAVEQMTGVAAATAEGGGVLAGMAGQLFGRLAVQTPALLSQVVLFFALLYFFLEGRMRLRNGLLRLCMTRRARLHAARVIRDSEHRVSRYLLTITAINTGLGLATAAAMTAIGLPNPILWGVLAFAVNFAPYLGPAVLGVLLFGAGLVSFDTLGWALVPALAFMALNTIEAYFITPTVVGSSLRLEPAILLVALVLLFGLWGIAGAVLSVPLVLVGQAIVRHVFPAN